MLLSDAGAAEASHAWNNFHWARTASPFTLEVGNNVDDTWEPQLAAVSAAWGSLDSVWGGVDSVLNMMVVEGGTNDAKGSSTPARCVPTEGRVEVCSESYGDTGWLGVAQVWTVEDDGEHIAQSVIKLNDTYFDTDAYNTPQWRQSVVCHELGHALGLGHHNEDFSDPNVGSCLDYTDDPTRDDGAGDNLGPSQHDYDQLALDYGHLDSFDSYISSVDGGDESGGGNGKGNGKGKPDKGKLSAAAKDVDLSDPSAWGAVVARDAKGRDSIYVRDLGNGEKAYTFVHWLP